MDNGAISGYVRAYIKRKKIKDAHQGRARELSAEVRACEAGARELMDRGGGGAASIGPIVWKDRAHYVRRVSRKRAVKPRDIEAVVAELVGEGEALSGEAVAQACYERLVRRVETFRSTVARTPAPGAIVAPSDAARDLIERFCDADEARKELTRRTSDETRAHTQSIAELKDAVIEFLETNGDAGGAGEKLVRSKKINVETRQGKIDMTLSSTTAPRSRSLTLAAMRRGGAVEAALEQIQGLASEDGTFPATEAVRSALITALADVCDDLCRGDRQTSLGVKLRVQG